MRAFASLIDDGTCAGAGAPPAPEYLAFLIYDPVGPVPVLGAFHRATPLCPFRPLSTGFLSWPMGACGSSDQSRSAVNFFDRNPDEFQLGHPRVIPKMSAKEDEGVDCGLYLGLDLSTQSLTAVAVDHLGHQTHTHSTNFLTDLHRHITPVHRAPPFATTPSTLFLEAIDTLFSALQSQGFPFHLVRGMSGAAQQHGSVFVSADFLPALRALSPSSPLLPQIPISAFAFPDGPIWEDSSTVAECEEIEAALGGPVQMAAVTGARATLRFTGPQILARSRRSPEQFSRVERVAVISAFLGSLLAGDLIPEDVADASGTHMFDIRSDPPCWFTDAVRAASATGLLAPAPVQSYARVGSMSTYFCTRYGFSPNTPLVAFTGDNPATIAAVGGLRHGDLLVSLGTSDTAQWVVDEGDLSVDQRGAEIAMTFRSPLTAAPSYVRMLVYSNGSLTREAVRDAEFSDAAGARKKRDMTWDEFEELVKSVPEGCVPAKVGCFYRRPEIAPRAGPDECARVVDARSGKPVEASHAELCRLVLEWRALVFAAHLNALGPQEPQRVLLTGGAASSKVIPQILADVLGTPVYKVRASASAALGAARRARMAVMHELGRKVALDKDGEGGSLLIAEPRAEITRRYRAVHLPAYERCFEPEWSAGPRSESS